MTPLRTALILVGLAGLFAAGCWTDKVPTTGSAPNKTEPAKPNETPKPPSGVLADPGTLAAYRSQAGKVLLFEVTGSDAGTVYGTDVYTDDSALASAAVHAGVLKVGQKGVVKVTLMPGRDAYPASTRNGITSVEWEKWDGSFRVEPSR